MGERKLSRVRCETTMARYVALLWCVLAAAWAPRVVAQDEPHGVREFTESGTWRVPDGVTRVTVELWGAGGGGAGGGSAAVATGPGGGGGGGGSGAYVRASLSVTAGETYTITIGVPGSGGRGESRGAAQPGGDGGDTSIRNGGVVLMARGGRGGGAPKFGNATGGAAGPGGVADEVPARVVRPGNAGTRGQDGGFSEWNSSPGGAGGAAVLGTLQPPESFGGAGGTGRHFGYSDDGKSGGAGSLVITW
jgi:hypothetical protein